MRIALDAMGTDRSPVVEVQGAIEALRNIPGEFQIALVGDETRIREEIDRYDSIPPHRLEIVHASERVEPGEPPAAAVRRKPDSSIVVGLSLQQSGEADAFVSAGSTGAVMAASLIILRPVTGVMRPAVATILPTAKQPLVMLDAGANVDCKPHQLLQFARLGSIYAEDVLERPRPRVGLLNIGEEPEKGNELSVEAHRLLEQSELQFVGNVEGRDVIDGGCDVLVTDGFTGNVLLKFYESVAGFITSLLVERFGDLRGPELAEVTRVLDYTEYGGAPLLGVDGISIICHGGSPPQAICNAIGVAIQAVETHMVGHIRARLGQVASPLEVPDSGSGSRRAPDFAEEH